MRLQTVLITTLQQLYLLILLRLRDSKAHGTIWAISWVSYEEAVKAYDPYLELAEKWFNHEKDGGLVDMIQGTADATGMDFNDAMMMFPDKGSEQIVFRAK